MDISQYDAAIDALETDREKLKRLVRAILTSEMSPSHGVNEEQAERIAAPALKQSLGYARESITLALSKLPELQMELRRALTAAREVGELRPLTAESQIDDNRRTLSAKLYKALELDAIRALLKPGERIIKIDWFQIETDRGQIMRRADLPKVFRPITFRDGDSWRRGFVSASRVQEAIEAENGGDARHLPPTGPSRWIE